MDEEERELTQRWATCLTAGCGSYGAHMHILTVEGCDVECGSCGNPITRLEENAPAEPKEMPTWTIE